MLTVSIRMCIYFGNERVAVERLTLIKSGSEFELEPADMICIKVMTENHLMLQNHFYLTQSTLKN